MSAAPSVSERLIDCVAGITADTIPASVRKRAEDLLIDIAGLCVAARDTEYVKALVASVDGGGKCTALGHGGSFSAEDAAMINGSLAHADETDDNYSAGGAHPGCAVVPAALAIGEALGSSGRSFLHAVTLGYDVGTPAADLRFCQVVTVPNETLGVTVTVGSQSAAFSVSPA